MLELKTSTAPQFYDHLWQSLAEGFIVLDQQGDVVAANELAALVLGYDDGSIEGRSYREFWPVDLSPPTTIKSASGRTHRVNARRPDGRFVPVSLTIFPLSGLGEGHRLVALGNPDQIEHVNEALMHTQRLSGIGMLMAGVAHELVTPISIITNTCSNMLAEIDDGPLLKEDLVRYVQMIEQSVWRCTRIVDVLRHYSFNEAQQMAFTDLKTIVADALTLVQHQFLNEFRVGIKVEAAPDLKSIVCDHNRLTQVLINLLINARDAMQPAGGIIDIKMWALPLANYPQPHVGSAVSNGVTAIEEYALSVSDSGHGIDPAILDKIFNPFFTTKSNGKGTGLGLFLARQIVTQHNGRIWAENNPEGGATFTVVIPRKQ